MDVHVADGYGLCGRLMVRATRAHGPRNPRYLQRWHLEKGPGHLSQMGGMGWRDGTSSDCQPEREENMVPIGDPGYTHLDKTLGTPGMRGERASTHLWAVMWLISLCFIGGCAGLDMSDPFKPWT